MPTIPMLRDPARARAASRAAALLVVATVGLGGCSSVERWSRTSSPADRGDYSTASIATAPTYATPVHSGVAAWDGDISAPGMTAAHPTLPLGSWARVTNSTTTASATVRITRRLVAGPRRTIELSRDAAAQIGAMQAGGAMVMIEPLDPRATTPAERAAATPTVRRPAPVATATAYDPSVSTASIPTARAPSPVVAPRATYSAPRYLQIGSYRSPSNAIRMKDRLTRERLSGGVYGDAHVDEVVVSGLKYYRVRVGPIATMPEAASALRQARALGHTDARVLKP
ncbi:MAG: SPOR domain-containing protein [Neomegalonema sp.]|nr:SPOR domain-containing protein [Neomegalonema sp.]